MKKLIFTTVGMQVKELTQEEIETFADNGDYEAKREILNQELYKAANDTERIDAIVKYLK